MAIKVHNSYSNLYLKFQYRIEKIRIRWCPLRFIQETNDRLKDFRNKSKFDLIKLPILMEIEFEIRMSKVTLCKTFTSKDNLPNFRNLLLLNELFSNL